MAKVFVVSNGPVPDGYGRIFSENTIRLATVYGHDIYAAGLPYDGLLPASYDGRPYPFWISSLNSVPDWPNKVLNLLSVIHPDVVIVIQDAPYLEAVRNLPYDWSTCAFIGITPADGIPFASNWVKLAKQADSWLTISEFGAQEWRKVGVPTVVCPPGVSNKFKPLSPEKRLEIREKLNITPDAFVMGIFAQNQGRKSIGQMMKGYFDFAVDKPTSRLLLDMDKLGGLNLPDLIEQHSWDASKVIFREDAFKVGIMDIVERYNVLDVHVVLSFREGFGLPLIESQACGVVSIANDYCSGPEICGDDRGILIPPIDYFYPSGWGGALDMLPDYRILTTKLQWLYDNPLERAAMAERGRLSAVKRTWDNAAAIVDKEISRVLEARSKARTAPAPQPATAPPPPPQTAPVASQPDGVVKEVELIESRPAL